MQFQQSVGVATDAAQAAQLRSNHAIFVAVAALSCLLVRHTLAAWLQLSLMDSRFSHLWLIPLISAGMILELRHTIFSRTERALDGVLAIVVGAILYGGAYRWSSALGQVDDLTLAISGLVVVFAGLFRLCYGRSAWRAARFPLAFLAFMIPMPTLLLDRVIEALQKGSATIVDGLLTLLQVPFVRDGLRFDLAGLSIEIAQECSGIRSSTALVILTVLLAHYSLRATWRKLLLVTAVIPVVFFKNGLRIVTLSLLAIHVDPSFITGAPHRDGGFVFFGLMLLVLVALCWVLRKSEAPVVDTK